MAATASDSRLEAAQKAINSIGLGFDITQDICFDNCKKGPRLIFVNEEQCRNLHIPGGVSIANVPNSIKCVPGESIRVHSEVLNLEQMLMHFNQPMRLAGQIATGHFCASFGLSGRPIKDFYSIKSLAYDGWFNKRYAIELEKYHGELLDHVKKAVPPLWDPKALERFIQCFGTHVIVGVSMGGKDVLYVRQEKPSDLDPTSIQKLLKDTASMKFEDSAENHCLASEDLSNQKNLFVIHCRRGGSIQKVYHSEWLETIDSEPDVISMVLLPLTSLLSRIRGSGFVSYAISLYLRYKPPIEDLHQFLEFQLRRLWAPVPSETDLGFHRKHQAETWIRFSIFGPKLYINKTPVDVGSRPVVGLRLRLEGWSSNWLAIHLQHLESLPMSLSLSDNTNTYLSCCDSSSCNLHEKVKWNSLSYVCTAPVESDDSVSIVTGAQLHVENKCLILMLRFSEVIGATLLKEPEWSRSSGFDQFLMSGVTKEEIQQQGIGCLSSLIQGIISKEEQRGRPKPGDKTIGSSPYSAGFPSPVHTPKLQRFVDTKEIQRGPEDTPGYWVVSGAKLSAQHGKICLLVKYSLFSINMQGEAGAS
ncbi:MACPF domain-containing protein At4g24290 [Cajanus cajan]|uniref:MACPF domain-containing protein At4g24290 n=1 Tax=Cajanus cajan TaxID=3821 RepID=UPI00098D9F25|nr:MACPF domain-containing protein At4g24290 [Cajanus cajan]